MTRFLLPLIGTTIGATMLAAGQPMQDPGSAMNTTITAVGGVKVGHHTLSERPTGCTVVLVEDGAVAGVDVRGSAPGTRETDLLNPINLVQQVQAIVLSGGSAFGLDAVVICPIGFVCDHVEVLYDLDTEAAAVATQLGITITRAKTACDHPAFLDGLADMVRRTWARYERGRPLPIVVKP